MNALGPQERRELTAVLRKPNTFLDEDVTDVVAILQILKKQRDNTGLSAGHFAGRRRTYYHAAKKEGTALGGAAPGEDRWNAHSHAKLKCCAGARANISKEKAFSP